MRVQVQKLRSLDQSTVNAAEPSSESDELTRPLEQPITGTLRKYISTLRGRALHRRALDLEDALTLGSRLIVISPGRESIWTTEILWLKLQPRVAMVRTLHSEYRVTVVTP